MLELIKRAFYWSSGSASAWASLFRLVCTILYGIIAEARSNQFNLFSLKRGAILGAIIVLLPALLLWNHIGLALDDIIFPSWRQEGLSNYDNNIVFIVGNARSGTTWVHRLLSMEKAQFTHMATWEIMFAVSITWRILIFYIYDLDEYFFRSIFYSALTHLEKRLLGGVRVHPIGLQLAEEDDWLMCHVGLSQLVTFFLPCAVGLYAPIIQFDQSLSKKTKDCIFNYYAACVQKHRYAHMLRSWSASKTCRTKQHISYDDPIRHFPIYLSKSPPFTNRIGDLCERFPHCLVVCMVRQPSQSVPSMVSYIAKVWGAFATPRFRYPDTLGLFQMCVRSYLLPLRYMPRHASGGATPCSVLALSSASPRDGIESEQDDNWRSIDQGIRVINLLCADDVEFLIHARRSRSDIPSLSAGFICNACAVLKYWELKGQSSELPRVIETIIRNILTFFKSTSSDHCCYKKKCASKDIYTPSSQFFEELSVESQRKFVSDHVHSVSEVFGAAVSEAEFEEIFQIVASIYQIPR